VREVHIDDKLGETYEGVRNITIKQVSEANTYAILFVYSEIDAK